MDRRELAKQLGLDATEQRILALYYVEKLNVTEIAMVMDMTAFEVAAMHRWIMARARALKQKQKPK